MWSISLADDGTTEPTITGFLAKPLRNMPHGPRKSTNRSAVLRERARFSALVVVIAQSAQLKGKHMQSQNSNAFATDIASAAPLRLVQGNAPRRGRASHNRAC